MAALRSCCIVLGMTLLILGGCSKPPRQTSGAPESPQPPVTSATAITTTTEAENDGPPVDGDSIVIRTPAEMPTLNPLTATDVYAFRILDVVFDTLLEYDNETLKLKPLAAESYTVSDDHLTFTFVLKPGIVFSDGQPLTAEDIKFTYDKLMDPAVDAAALRNYYQNVSSCEVIDARTVKFTCKEPYFKSLGALGGLPIMPKHIYSQGDFNNHPNNRKPIGSGPYTVESWETNQSVVLVRNEKYWGQKPHLLRREYKFIVDDNAALQVLTTGGLDFMGMTPEQWNSPTVSDPAFTAKFNKAQFLYPGYSYIGWNMTKPMFSDKMVRRALTMLLDRDTILKTIYHGLGTVVSGHFFINGPECDKAIKPWPFDPAQAKQLLDAAGWVDRDSDGVRDKDGQSFKFEILLPSGSPEAEQLATVYQEELKRAGIALTIRPLEWATFLESIDKRNFDACMLSWGLVPDPDPYQVWHSSQADKGSNRVAFMNPEADRLIEEARREFDLDKRVALYHKFHAILHEEQPYTFLFDSMALAAIDKRYRNVRTYPMYFDLREWWVPLALQRTR